MSTASTPRAANCLAIGLCLLLATAGSSALAFEQTSTVPLTTTPPVTSDESPVPNPAALPGKPSAPSEQVPALRVFMPDGQLKSHSIRVYVARDIPSTQKVRLRLLRPHPVTKGRAAKVGDIVVEPLVVAPNQEWIETVDGQQVSRLGTLLLFDISNIDFEYKAMIRFMPVVTWEEAGVTQVAAGDHEVNVGNSVAVIGWTLLIVGLALLLVVVLSYRAKNNPILLLTGVDGHLSLSQTQIACWTVAIGSVVLGYGFIKLEIPNIPLSLLALMGASLATGGIGYFKDEQKQQAAINNGVNAVNRQWAMSDLIYTFPTGDAAPEPSLSKTQMLFWTVLILVMFVSKSILDGVVWEVPWPIVALMGFSQAGYLAPKVAPQI